MSRVATIATRRLVLRPWRASDAPALKLAIDTSLEHLRPWMPWAANEPTPLEELAARLRRFRCSLRCGSDAPFGLFERGGGEVVGGAGLHPRIGAGGLEIGYWVRCGLTGRGYATEAAAALTRLGFEVGALRFMEIHCDPGNVRSAAVPERLGYRLETTVANWTPHRTAAPRATMFWRLLARDYPGSAAAAAEPIEVCDMAGDLLMPPRAAADD